MRRMWILPLSMVAVAGLAYEVSSLRAATYTAQSTVVVSSVPGPVNLVSAGPAADLATTYADAVPQDQVLQRYVARKTGLPTGGAISALPSRGSLVRLTFTANSPAAAQAGAQAIANGLTGGSPASAVVTPGTLVVVHGPSAVPAAGATAATTPTATGAAGTATGTGGFQSEVVLMVPATAGPIEGINPNDAERLAITYAGIIPVDARLLSNIGKAVNESSSEVGQNLSVVNEQNTAILQLSFKSGNPQTAAAGARAAARLLTGPRPIAAGVVPSSLQVVALPASVQPAATSKSSAVAIGAALGLLLGLVLLVAWERSDPHVTDARELSKQLGCPATPGERLSLDAARALLERWTSLIERVPVRVAVLPADSGTETETAELVKLLVHAGGESVRYVDARSGVLPEPPVAESSTEDRAAAMLVHAGSPGEKGAAGEAVALGCDLTVVVVRAGARAAALRQLAEELGNFGIVPAWALLTPRGLRVVTERTVAGAVSA
jgi:capsular polysaccharide biosynthesis protein